MFDDVKTLVAADGTHCQFHGERLLIVQDSALLMIAVSQPTKTRIRNAIVAVMAVGVFGLLFSRPFLPPWWRANAGDLICMVGVIGFSLVLLFNKIACGVFFPGPQRGANRHLRD